VATAAIGIGLGLSPYVTLVTGLVAVVVYLVLSINTYLETQTLGVFSLGYGRLGPTEARLALIALNTLLAVGVLAVLDPVVWAIVALMLGAVAVRAARNLRTLAAREPAQAAR
jgi:hypothetical protein